MVFDFFGYSKADIIAIRNKKIFLVKSEINELKKKYTELDLKKSNFFKIQFGSKNDRSKLTEIESAVLIPNFILYNKPILLKPNLKAECKAEDPYYSAPNGEYIGELVGKESEYNFYILVPDGYQLTQNVKKQRSNLLDSRYKSNQINSVQKIIDKNYEKSIGLEYPFLDDTKNDIRYYFNDNSLLGYYIYNEGSQYVVEINQKNGKDEWKSVNSITVNTAPCD